MNPEKEFRIFVHQRRVTAISTQHLYSVNDWLNSLSDDELQLLVHNLVTYCQGTVIPRLRHVESYVMDLALVEPEERPYFIEINPFGRQYSSGSALYSWLADHQQLTNPDRLELRYVSTCN